MDRTELTADDRQWLASLPGSTDFSDRQGQALVALRHGQTWSRHSYGETFGLGSREARSEIAQLSEAGLIEAVGEQRGGDYRLAV